MLVSYKPHRDPEMKGTSSPIYSRDAETMKNLIPPPGRYTVMTQSRGLPTPVS